MRTSILLFIVSIIILRASTLSAAVVIEVKYKGKAYPVIAVDGSRPVIEVDGERRTVSSSSLTMRRDGGTPFKEGYYGFKDKRIRSQSLRVRGNSRNKNLVFTAEIMTSTDLEGAFMVLASPPRDGKSQFFLNELPDLKANEWTQLHVIEIIGPSYPAVKATKHFFFVNGEQLLTQQEVRQERRKRNQR